MNLKLEDLNGAVLLVGSMLSADRETGLPNGLSVADAIIDRMLRKLEETSPDTESNKARIRIIRKFARETPFEQLFNAYPFDQDAKRIFSEAYRGGKPNIFHLKIAKAVEKGRVAAVITTNYDTCIEQSIIHKHLVIEERHVASRGSGTNIFKVHGCVTKPSSIIYRLQDEGVLPEWKRRYLASLVQDRDIVLIGYSGRDFDICPILLRCNYRSLHWLFPGADLQQQLKWESQNARHVFHNPEEFPRARAIIGGFDAFFDAGRSFQLSHLTGDLVEQLHEKEGQYPEAFAHWRASVFNAISCRIGTDANLRNLSSAACDEPRFVRLSSDSLERAGKYRDSISKVRRLRNLIDRSNQPDAWLETFVIEVGRFYTAGYFGQVGDGLKKLRNAISSLRMDRIKFDEDLAFARETYLYLLRRKRIPSAIPFGAGILYRIMSRTIDVSRLQKAADVFYARGLWQELRLIHQAASDFRIVLDVGADSERHLLLSAIDGFSQLNNLVGRAAAYRKSAQHDITTCEDILEGLWAYGHNPEYWKCVLAFYPTLNPIVRVDTLKRAGDAFAQCQYSPIITLVNFVRLLRKGVLPRYRRVR